MVCTPGWRTSAAPTSPSPGSSAMRVGGDAAGPQRLDDHRRAARRLLGRLEHDGVARRQARGDHPERDRQREVPRGDDRDHAAGAVVHLVALARHDQQRAAPVERDGRPGVVLEEVDGLADVRVGLGPGLGRLADGERGGLVAALAQPRRRVDEGLRALEGRHARPGVEAAGRGLDGGRDVGGGGGRAHGDDALGVPRVVGERRVALAALLPDQHGHADGQPGVDAGQRGREQLPVRRAAQLQDGLVDERAEAHAGTPGAASRRSSGTPEPWSWRKESLLVFSSRRRTR